MLNNKQNNIIYGETFSLESAGIIPSLFTVVGKWPVLVRLQ